MDRVKIESNLKAALRLCEKDDYQLILLNLERAECSSFEFLERVMFYKPKMNILTFSESCNIVYALKALKIGAKGYFSKDIPGKDFMKAVEQVATGSKYIHADLAQKMALQMINDDPHPCTKLSTREFEIFRLVSQGYDNHQIAEKLYLSYKTTCNYVSKIKEKLNVHNNVQLMNLAYEYELVSYNYQSIQNSTPL